MLSTTPYIYSKGLFKHISLAFLSDILISFTVFTLLLVQVFLYVAPPYTQKRKHFYALFCCPWTPDHSIIRHEDTIQIRSWRCLILPLKFCRGQSTMRPSYTACRGKKALCCTHIKICIQTPLVGLFFTAVFPSDQISHLMNEISLAGWFDI